MYVSLLLLINESGIRGLMRGMANLP